MTQTPKKNSKDITYVVSWRKLAAGSYRTKTLKQIKAEIAKCEVRCANCHLKKDSKTVWLV